MSQEWVDSRKQAIQKMRKSSRWQTKIEGELEYVGYLEIWELSLLNRALFWIVRKLTLLQARMAKWSPDAIEEAISRGVAVAEAEDKNIERSGLECVCYENTDARLCYELRYYGYSPVLRDSSDHSEGLYMTVDRNGECECVCHDVLYDSDDYC